jgi:cell cycle sensor histidine kinase DivJ
VTFKTLTDRLQASADTLVHPSARGDALTELRHRSLILSQLICGFIAVAAIPLYIAFVGVPALVESITFIWLTVPLLIAAFLSRTGNLEAAHLMSSASFVGLLSTVAWLSGGFSLSYAAWMVLVPIEAALSGSRRVVISAMVMALLSLIALDIATLYDLLPMAKPLAFGALSLLIGPLIAVVYAASVAVGLQKFQVRPQTVAEAESERYRLLAEYATDLITRHTRGGNVVFASPAASDLIGINPDALLGDGLFRKVHVADRPAYLKAIADAASSPAGISIDFRIQHHTSKHFIWVEMRLKPFGGVEGEHGLVAVTRDVTDRKANEDQLEAANAEARRAADAKQRFLASVSHELRTPLNAIIGFSEMITTDMASAFGPDKTKEYAGLINDSGKHLLEVVNGILDISKLEAGSFSITCEPFDGAALVRNCVELIRPAADKAGVKLELAVDSGGRELVADRRACKQIYLNLLSNAVKFTEAGGTVTAGLTLGRDGAILFVRDTGIGISEEDLPRLGEPFMQAERKSYDRNFEGTGLGLSVVKGLSALHGGEMTMASRLGVGTTVTITMPEDSVTAGLVALERTDSDVTTDLRSRRVA